MKPLLLNEIKNCLRAELKTPFAKGLASGISIDSRKTKAGDLFIALPGERYDGHDFIEEAVEAGAVAVLMDRNIPLSEELKSSGVCLMKVDHTLTALGEVARMYRKSLGHAVMVIAVTGSNGKTTTREMIYHVLSQSRKGHRSPHNYNNLIGVPLTLFGIEQDHEFAVVEIATNQAGEIATLSRMVQPDVAVITSVARAHLEGLKDIEGVCREKVSIVAGLKERGVVICGNDQPGLIEQLRPLGRHVITFGLDATADISATKVRRQNNRMCFETNDHCEMTLPLWGMHNVRNALAALAAVRRMGLSSDDFARGMSHFAGVDQRMTVHHVNGVTIIDDTYNANPDSMAVALEELTSHRRARRRVFICADMNELGAASEMYHRQLGQQVAASNVDVLFAVGRRAALTAEAAIESGMGQGSVQRFINSKRLARLVKSLILDGDLILVKGSRSMEMELVVDSLKRFRGSPVPPAHSTIQSVSPGLKRSARRDSKVIQ